jgi:hypothetical protein
MKDSKLDRAFLNVKHSVGDIALLEHVLILWNSNTCFPAPTLARKFVKHVLVWLLHGSLLWLDQFQNFSAPNCCRASGIVCDLEEVPDRSLILGNQVVIAHRLNLWIDSDDRFYDVVPLICADDDEAIEKAKQLADGHDVELWQRDRKVARFDDKPKIQF